MKYEIHWFASTGAFHRNGSSFVRRAVRPAQDDKALESIARSDAEKFAREVGKPLKEFHVQIIGAAVNQR